MSTPREESPAQPGAQHPLAEVALLFLRLGFTAFGGPAAHIAMMEDEVVRRRQWLPREEFIDLLGATNLIPGPNSTELAIHLGHRRAGWPGLLVAGACFILPAALIVGTIAWAYVRFGSLPAAESLLYGVKPVIIAIVLQALWGLGRAAIKTRPLAAVALASVGATIAGVPELAVLFSAGVAMALGRWARRRARAGGGGSALGAALMLGPPTTWPALATAAAGAAVPFSLQGLFLFFLKVGSVLFGSGYVLLAFLRADLVTRWGWLTEAQLLDAVAVGQVTPGPVFTTATFIGYVLGGVPGAAAATVGIFLPAFFFVAVSGPLVPRLRRSWVAGAFLDGVNVASLALMAVVTWELGRSALVDVWTVGLAVLSAGLLVRYRLNSAWLVLGGGALGLALKAAGLS
ncbi:MAG: chromate efflux transporter [Hyalangium sp.]|uniref:chromate efflux transporter n=1 Tax=Hyalangium sp. TaxID=2028555 RepID=UPI00389ADCD3